MTISTRPRRRPAVLRLRAAWSVSSGPARVFWRLLARGAVLLMFTLGIYRFWLTTDIRRFLWSNTELAGESFEYTGTARELLLGFLIAIAILVPLYAAFFFLALSAGAIGEMSGSISPRRADPARPLRRLPGAALSPDPHGLSRRALPSDRLGLALCGLRPVLVDLDRADARPRLSVRAVAARTLQDAQHLLRQPARPLRRLGPGAARCAALLLWFLAVVPFAVGARRDAHAPSTGARSRGRRPATTIELARDQRARRRGRLSPD